MPDKGFYVGVFFWPPFKVLIQDPCLLGLPEIRTVAPIIWNHGASLGYVYSFLWHSDPLGMRGHGVVSFTNRAASKVKPRYLNCGSADDRIPHDVVGSAFPWYNAACLLGRVSFCFCFSGVWCVDLLLNALSNMYLVLYKKQLHHAFALQGLPYHNLEAYVTACDMATWNLRSWTSKVCNMRAHHL